MRKDCAVTEVEALRQSDHVCWTYASDEEYRSTLLAFVADGLSRRERTLVMPRAGWVATTLELFADADHVVGDADEQLAVVPVDDVQVPGGTLEPSARLREFEAAVDRALADGFRGLRVFGDATDRLAEPEIARWAGYELRADALAARLPLTILCGFDLRECGRRDLELVAAVHPVSLDRHDPVSPCFRLHVTDEGSLRLSGELDLASAAPVRQLLGGVIADVSNPSLDVAGLRFADVAGCRALASALCDLGQIHGEASLVDASDELRALWGLLGYDDAAHTRSMAA